MLALAPHQIGAVERTIAYLQPLAESLPRGIERGDLTITLDLLREVLAEAEEHG